MGGKKHKSSEHDGNKKEQEKVKEYEFEEGEEDKMNKMIDRMIFKSLAEQSNPLNEQRLIMQDLKKRVEQAEKEKNKNNYEELINMMTHNFNELDKKIGDLNDKIDNLMNDRLVQNENICTETLKNSFIMKDLMLKNNAMINDVMSEFKEKSDVDDSYKTMEIINDTCWIIKDKVSKNNQMLYECIEEKNENAKIKENEKKKETINDKTCEIVIKMEEKNAKIVKDLETKNINLANKNLKLKDRITNINQNEWKSKFTINLQKKSEENVTHLNITDTTKFKDLNEEQFENLETFTCYQCNRKFKMLNIMMNHRRKDHKCKTKCKYVNNCLYKENCWFNHMNTEDEDETQSVKSYYTT